jgi:hypothetical protein
MSNSGRKASTFAEAMRFDAKFRMHVIVTRGDSRGARYSLVATTRQCASECGRRMRAGGENL